MIASSPKTVGWSNAGESSQVARAVVPPMMTEANQRSRPAVQHAAQATAAVFARSSSWRHSPMAQRGHQRTDHLLIFSARALDSDQP
jgi:hypothetical protein